MPDKTPGLCGQELAVRREYLTLSFSPLSAPLCSRWRNNGLSADFLGDYVTTFLPAGDDIDGAGNNHDEIRHAVAYIANEFLENAMKYHERDADIPIGILLELTSEQIVVSASNGVNAGQAKRYQAFLERISTHHASDLLLRQLQQGPADGPNESGAGILTMISDYGAQIGWRFEAHAVLSGLLIVTTSAVLSLRNLAGVPA